MQSTLKLARKSAELIIICAFCLAILLPAVGFFNAWVNPAARRGSEGEQPDRAPQLQPNLRSFLAFPNNFRFYFERHFGFRPELIRSHGILKVQGLGVSSTPRVVVGRDGWLYYAEEESMESYRCLKPFSQTELERWRMALEARRNWLARRGIPYLFVLVPDKHTIYPEYLPSTVKRSGRSGRLDQLTEYLSRYSDVPVLDLRPALLDAKTTTRLYQKTDTHWNERGAYLGYAEILKRLNAQIPVLAPIPHEQFLARSTGSRGGDLARFLGLQDVLGEELLELQPRIPRQARMIRSGAAHSQVMDVGYEPLVVTQRSGAPVARAVFFRDSFTSQMMPFLAEHFDRAVFVWTDGFDPQVVLRERPQVVVQQLVERKLMRLEPESGL